jgi:hypothetical protein
VSFGENFVDTPPDYLRAWLAAVLDTDGSIGAMFANSGTCVQIGLQVQLTEKGYGMLNTLQEHFAGKIHRRPDPPSPNHAPARTWKCTREDDVTYALVAAMPYLIIKRQQAERALFALSHPSSAPERFKVYHEMKALNQKGPQDGFIPPKAKLIVFDKRQRALFEPANDE